MQEKKQIRPAEVLAAVFSAVRRAAGKACLAAWGFAWHRGPAREAWARRQVAGFANDADRLFAGVLLSAALAAVGLASIALAAASGVVYLAAWAAEALARKWATKRGTGTCPAPGEEVARA